MVASSHAAEREVKMVGGLVYNKGHKQHYDDGLTTNKQDDNETKDLNNSNIADDSETEDEEEIKSIKLQIEGDAEMAKKLQDDNEGELRRNHKRALAEVVHVARQTRSKTLQKDGSSV